MTSPSYPSPRPRVRVITTTPLNPECEPPSGSEPEADAAQRLTADPDRRRRKRKPNKGSFPKGVSGNLRGRPKGAKGVKPMVRKILSGRIPIQTSRGSKKVAYLEALLKKEAAMAAEGDWRARRTIFEFAKWALGDNAELPADVATASPEELTKSGKEILAWYSEEIKSGAREAGQ